MRFLALICIFGLSFGCTTAPTIVKHTVNPKTVTVEYENAGFETSIKKNRKEAIVKAAKFCNTEPKFMSEEKVTRTEADLNNKIENKEFIQLTFACK